VETAQIVDAFLKLAKEHGAFTAFFITGIFAHYLFIYWLIRQIIKSKDKEIERLVDSRNKLQDNLLEGDRLSTRKKKK